MGELPAANLHGGTLVPSQPFRRPHGFSGPLPNGLDVAMTNPDTAPQPAENAHAWRCRSQPAVTSLSMALTLSPRG